MFIIQPIRWSLPEDFFRRPAVIVLSLALFAGLLWGIQVVPKWQVQWVGVHTGADLEASKPAEVASLENEHRKTDLQALGGIFAIIALWYTYRRVKVSEEGQITDRYTKAIEQLGALTAENGPNIEVRLGAIYALERIAQDSPRDHWTIMEVLTTYVRRNAPAPTEPPTEEENKVAIKKGPRTEIQAILTVLGRRKRDRTREHERQLLDLMDCDLRGSTFVGAHLEGAIFEETHLEGAYFSGVDFQGAHFVRAHLERAKFSGADFQKAYFSGAHLQGANFCETHLERADFAAAQLEQAVFYKVHMERAYFGGAVGLNVRQIMKAHGWEQALFDEPFRRKLEAAKQKAVTAEEDRAPLETPSDETHPAEEDAG
jgi:hypothetical protein